MKKGRIAVLGQLGDQQLAALIVDGRLVDLYADAPDTTAPQPEAIYRARTTRPMKGQNGVMLDLGHGRKGFLKQARGLAPGTPLLVQISTHAEPGKAPPVNLKLLFKSRYAIITPDAPGLNVARRISDEDERVRLHDIAHDALAGAPDTLGLILRSACEGADAQEIFADITDMRAKCEKVAACPPDVASGLLQSAPTAHTRAWRDWEDPDEVVHETGSFETLGVWDHIEALKTPQVPLPAGASMIIEPTSALVAVDVNTGGDFSLTAGMKANLATARDLPRQLRLRGLGGQIVIDFAPMPKKDRRQIEHALRAGFKADGIETILVGWTTLGLFEVQRKRERVPLSELLAE
jgi:ribonuclease G